jgi:DnaJ-class molecular chaperone
MDLMSREIVVCQTCGGTGKVTTPRTPEQHGVKVDCHRCDGLRVVERITYEQKVEQR